VRALAAVDLVADLPPGVVDQDLALAALDEDDESRDQHDQGDDEDRRQRPMAPVRTSSNSPPIAVGRPATMPEKIRIEMPLPRPRSVICSPSTSGYRAGDQRDHADEDEHEARIEHQPLLRLQGHRDAVGLHQRQAERGVARVLRDLPPTGLTSLRIDSSDGIT